jgi:hypothetical protein
MAEWNKGREFSLLHGLFTKLILATSGPLELEREIILLNHSYSRIIFLQMKPILVHVPIFTSTPPDKVKLIPA